MKRKYGNDFSLFGGGDWRDWVFWEGWSDREYKAHGVNNGHFHNTVRAKIVGFLFLYAIYLEQF